MARVIGSFNFITASSRAKKKRLLWLAAFNAQNGMAGESWRTSDNAVSLFRP